MTRRYGKRGWVDRRRPRVLDVAPGLIHESGPVRGRDWIPDRVAVMAHWSTSGEPSRSVVTMLRELDAAGYETVLVSAAQAAGPIGRVCTWVHGGLSMPEQTTILRRANVGYDFGSWACSLVALPGLAAASRVLLVNDSLIGPFSPIAGVLVDFEACRAPVWGLSRSLQHRPHLQSFFIGYKDGILEHPALVSFWVDVRVESCKAKIVRFNELGLSEVLDSAGIASEAMLSSEQGGAPNPMIDNGADLLEAGLPFVKAELVTAPPAWLVGWERLPGVLDGAAVTSLADWLPPGSGIRPPPRSNRIPRMLTHARTVRDIEGWTGAARSALGQLPRRSARTLSRRRLE